MKKIYPVFVVDRLVKGKNGDVLWMPIPVVAGDSVIMRGSRMWFSTN